MMNLSDLLVAKRIVQQAQAYARRPVIRSFFDPATSSVTHVLSDPASRAAMIVDPVLDFDAASGRTASRNVDAVVAYVMDEGLAVELILDTHVHADHLSAASTLQARLGASIGIGQHIEQVEQAFAGVFQMDNGGPPPFDRFMKNGERFALGELQCISLHVPGHTPADMAYVVGDAVLTGDTLFMPDVGTARADFPGGDARQLFRSVRDLLSLPEHTAFLHCHDYPPPEREPDWRSTVAEQRRCNIHVRDGIGEDDFVAMRTARDATLATPALLLPAIQVNLRGGTLPAPSPNGRRYLQIPLDAL